MKEMDPEYCKKVMEGFLEETMVALHLQGKQESGGESLLYLPWVSRVLLSWASVLAANWIIC